MSKPLTKRQHEVLAAVRRLQETCNPLPDAAVSYSELRAAVGTSMGSLSATIEILVGRGLLVRMAEGECVGDYQWTRNTYRAIAPEDVA